MSEPLVGAAALLLGDLVGLHTSPATEARLAAGLRERAAARRASPARYLAAVASDEDERQELVDRVVVPETSWFREPAHYDAVVEHVVASRPGPLLAWSIGCATGQEPYSLAIALRERGLADFRIMATDVSSRAVERTRAGWYRPAELRGLNAERRKRWLRPLPDGFQVLDALRRHVSVERHNLATDMPPPGVAGCSLVFCRNVFLYVRPDRITSFLERLSERLPAGSYLFLGTSERLPAELSDRFDLVRLGDAFAYRRTEPPRPKLHPLPPPAASASARRPSPARPVAAPAVHLPAEEQRLNGEEAARRGEHRTAVDAFRRAVYLDGDDALAHLQLALSLEAIGDVDAARRAFRATKAALSRADRGTVEASLKGYRLDALLALLAAKLGESSCP